MRCRVPLRVRHQLAAVLLPTVFNGFYFFCPPFLDLTFNGLPLWGVVFRCGFVIVRQRFFCHLFSMVFIFLPPFCPAFAGIDFDFCGLLFASGAVLRTWCQSKSFFSAVACGCFLFFAPFFACFGRHLIFNDL